MQKFLLIVLGKTRENYQNLFANSGTVAVLITAYTCIKPGGPMFSGSTFALLEVKKNNTTKNPWPIAVR